ncbi:hypothetical protein ACFSQ7_26490 [Paenibacillus rhizoplanae]
MDNPLIQVKGITKVIGRQTLVEEISFQVPGGSILALCGGNGAGKKHGAADGSRDSTADFRRNYGKRAEVEAIPQALFPCKSAICRMIISSATGCLRKNC